MADYVFDIKIAENTVRTAQAKANSGDATGASASYARAAKLYEDLAAKVPERKGEFDSLASKYRNLSCNVPMRNASMGAGSIAAQQAQQAQPIDYGPVSEEDRQKAFDEGMKELNELVGLPGVKEKVNKLIKVKKVDAQMIAAGLQPKTGTQHLVFTGNPGTGKTTVARIIAKLYFGLGICQANKPVVETGRSDLVAGYVGQTADKTRKKIEEALGGVLFVDEAYTLSQGGENDFGKEAINELLTGMENHRNDLVVIAAGYEDSMQSFLEANEGLASRFKNFIDFEDYTDEDLTKIFKMMCKKSQNIYSPEGLAILKQILQIERSMVAPKMFGNSRTLRNVYEDIVETQKVRLADMNNPTKDQLMTLELDDFKAVLNERIKKMKKAGGDVSRFLNNNFTQSEPKVEVKNEQPQQNINPEPAAPSVNQAPVNNPAPSVSKKPYVLPPLDLLNDYPEQEEAKENNRQELVAVADLIVNKLKDFDIAIQCENIVVGPCFSRIECTLLSKDVKISKIEGLEKDINNAVGRPVRFLSSIRGKINTVGFELSNAYRSTIGLKAALQKEEVQKDKIKFLLGEDIEGKVKNLEFKSLPHMLVAGQTGSGKSVFLQCLINSVLFRYTPDEVKFVIIDFKRVEFFNYTGLPNLLTGKVIDEHQDALDALKGLCEEMDRRYQILAEDPVGCDSIVEYNAAHPDKPFPIIVCIIDEYADMIGSNLKKEFAGYVTRLVQKARAASIHVIISTQRPSVDVIDGVIKANLPTKVALSVARAEDSRNIINASGAQNLAGMGDMLMVQLGDPERYQSPFISKPEVKAVIAFIKQNNL